MRSNGAYQALIGFMFVSFLFMNKITNWLGIRISGLEYMTWIGLAAIGFVLPFALRNTTKFVIDWRYITLLLALLVFVFVNFLVVDVNTIPYLQGTFFTFLFAFNFIIFYNFRIDVPGFVFLLKLVVVVITLIGLAIYVERLFVPGSYNPYSLRGVVTLTKDPSFSAALLNINIAFSLGLFIITGGKKYLLVALFSLATIALMLYIKALVGSVIIAFGFVAIFFRSYTLRIVLYILACGLFVAIVFLGKPIYKEVEYKVGMYFGSNYETIPRNALYLASIRIASDHFPFGSGQGTFGSYPVGRNYSKIYHDYGLSTVHGLSPEDAFGLTDSHYIFDTHWSSVIGELGFIGAFLYLLLWSYPAMRIWSTMLHEDRIGQAIAFCIVMITVDIFIESIAAPLPGQLQFIVIYSGIGAMAWRLLGERGPNSSKTAIR